jgi:hypothetical protein
MRIVISMSCNINCKMKGKLIGIEATILGSLSYVRHDVRDAIKKYVARFTLKYFYTCLHVIVAFII